MGMVVGWQLVATLSTTTPLEWLLRDGEITPTPSDVPMQWAVWVPKTKTLRELGIDVDELPSGTRASEIGQVPSDGGAFLPFLIEYRRIVESSDPREAVLQSLTSLGRENEEISEKLGSDLAQIFVCRELLELPGCGLDTAKRLYAAGYKCREEVIAAPPEALAEIRGIGLATVRRIQSVIQ